MRTIVICDVDFVNTAARLAGGAEKRGESILCSEAVHSATPPASLATHKLMLQPAGSIRMKGKQDEAKVFKPIRAPSRNGDDEKVAPVNIVGRDAEMELLLGALAGSHAGPLTGATLIAVEAGAGLGKTALVNALVCRAEAQPHHKNVGTKWMLLRGTEYDGSTPLLPCRSIVRWLLEQQGEPEADAFSWLLVCTQSCLHSTIVLIGMALFILNPKPARRKPVCSFCKSHLAAQTILLFGKWILISLRYFVLYSYECLGVVQSFQFCDHL
jgi:hypothetical protein